jgi:hypothetical protein
VSISNNWLRWALATRGAHPIQVKSIVPGALYLQAGGFVLEFVAEFDRDAVSEMKILYGTPGLPRFVN